MDNIHQINLLILAAKEFCERVERGEIHSNYTYNKLKTILKNLGCD